MSVEYQTDLTSLQLRSKGAAIREGVLGRPPGRTELDL